MGVPPSMTKGEQIPRVAVRTVKKSVMFLTPSEENIERLVLD